MEKVYLRNLLLITAVFLGFSLVSMHKTYAADIEIVDMYKFGEYTETWEIQPVWPPTGSETIGYTVRDGYWGKWAIGLMSMPANVKERVTKKLDYNCMDPAWSPDGKEIVFSTKENEKAQWRINSIDLKDGEISDLSLQADIEEEAVIPTQGDYSPCYSPDGERIVFIHCDKDGHKDVWTMYADGTSRKRLTDDGETKDTPKWSPGGKKIVFMKNWDIWIMNTDGSNLVQLTKDSKSNENPAWSPDGKRIVYSSCMAGNADIWVMDADAGNKTQLTLSEEPDDYPSWSANGKKIAFQRGRLNARIWIMDLKVKD